MIKKIEKKGIDWRTNDRANEPRISEVLFSTVKASELPDKKGDPERPLTIFTFPADTFVMAVRIDVIERAKEDGVNLIVKIEDHEVSTPSISRIRIYPSFFGPEASHNSLIFNFNKECTDFHFTCIATILRTRVTNGSYI